MTSSSFTISTSSAFVNFYRAMSRYAVNGKAIAQLSMKLLQVYQAQKR